MFLINFFIYSALLLSFIQNILDFFTYNDEYDEENYDYQARHDILIEIMCSDWLRSLCSALSLVP